MIIPHQELSPEALQAILEDFATREGTDYGETETPLAVKTAQIKRLLDAGHYYLLFDPELESVTIVAKDQLPNGIEFDDET
jgi:uncharacterized protein YheU (UPF0270 family)